MVQAYKLLLLPSMGNRPGGSPSLPGKQHKNTEFWNGSSWTELNNLVTARYGGGSIGTSVTPQLFSGGNDGSPARCIRRMDS